MKDTDLGKIRIEPRIDASPLQRPGGHRRVRTATIGGVTQPGDRRMYLHVSLLGKLLDIARSSSTSQVELPKVGVKVELYEEPNGHQYEVWSFVSGGPRPEEVPFGVSQFFRGS